MKNEEKFKTAEERVKAFNAFCDSPDCESCEIGKKRLTSGRMVCAMNWLALEAEDDKPEPCPFCGNTCSVCASTYYEHRIVCNNIECGYRSQAFPKESDADLIAAHNRVAKAVREAEKGEVK